MSSRLISIITPIYNNEGSIKELFSRLKNVYNEKLQNKNISIQLVIVDDGSEDNSFIIAKTEVQKLSDFRYKLIKLTRNFGSYNSFLAGMFNSDGDCCIYLHADLQDPPELIPQLFENYEKGFKLVIANRRNREDSSVFSSLYHWVIKKYGIKNVPPGGFDLMLFDKTIKNEIIRISEKNTNNVYLITWLGFPYVNIPYKRENRRHGKSQWILGKKIRLFIDSIFSFTSVPVFIIRMNTIVSIVTFVLITFLYVFYKKLNFEFIHLLISFIFFMLSLNLNILLEYLLRIHETVRDRPNYIVDNIIEKNS